MARQRLSWRFWCLVAAILCFGLLAHKHLGILSLQLAGLLLLGMGLTLRLRQLASISATLPSLALFLLGGFLQVGGVWVSELSIFILWGGMALAVLNIVWGLALVGAHCSARREERDRDDSLL